LNINKGLTNEFKEINFGQQFTGKKDAQPSNKKSPLKKIEESLREKLRPFRES